MAKVKIIIGSRRPVRFGDTIAKWVKQQAEATGSKLDFEVIDLREVDLPFGDEKEAPITGVYENAHTQEWAKIIASGDAFIFVSPEYNAGYSAVLKNALDAVYAEWSGKPVAIVAYGAGSGVAMARQLKEVLTHMKMKVVEPQLSIVGPWTVFGEDGSADESKIDGKVADIVSAIEEEIDV